jgi:hypothetical protein
MGTHQKQKKAVIKDDGFMEEMSRRKECYLESIFLARVTLSEIAGIR